MFTLLLIYPKSSNPLFSFSSNVYLATGTVMSIPETQYQSLQFSFKPKYSKNILWISWPHPPSIQMRVGEKWKLALKVKPTQKNWLRSEGIFLQGTVQFNMDNQMILPRENFTQMINHLREWIYLNIKQQLQSSKLSIFTGFISALTTGIRSDITQDQWKDLRGTGTNHLMAIAGLHIGILSWIIYRLCITFWRRSETLLLWKPAQIASIIVSFIFAVLYSMLAGFSLPTKRAIFMFSIFAVAKCAYVKIPMGLAYLFALSIILLSEPISIETATFWLSFTAVGLLIYTHANRIGKAKPWKELTKAQFVLAIGLAPLGLFFFQQTSLIGLIANVIAIPFIGFIILPICLIGIFFHPCWTFAAYLLHYFWPLMHGFANIPYTQWNGSINLLECLGLFWGILIIFAPMGFPHRWIGLLGCLPLLLMRIF